MESNSGNAENSGTAEDSGKARSRLASPQVRAAAVIVLAAAVGVGVWLGVRDSGSAKKTIPPVAVAAAATSASNLVALSTSTRRPLYWAGPQTEVTYEISQAADGRVWVRYLPTGTEPGTSTPYLTIGTYPLRDAFAATTRISRQAGSVRIAMTGGVAFYNRARPTNVYVAFRNTDYQVEIFNPSGAAAKQLVKDGAIVPVQTAEVDFRLPAAATTTATTTAPAATTVAATTPGITAASLSQSVAAIGHPVYWAGEQSAGLYELTQGSGRDWVRYLPDGVTTAPAGVTYRTVGTYALKDAFKATSAAAKGAGMAIIAVKKGIAFYAKTRPNNVYLAYRGVNYQIEVYDNDAAAAHELVASGQIVRIP